MADWHCPGCGNLNWARRLECNRCHAHKPLSASLMGAEENVIGIPLPQTYGQGGGSRSSSGASRPPHSSIDPSVGDWECAGCSNWNWARRSECNRCGQSHPTRAPRPPSKAEATRDRSAGLDTGSNFGTMGSNLKRTGEGGGFREFDADEDDRRKRRAIEERQEKESRKAEKKKCEYCKRFACIC